MKRPPTHDLLLAAILLAAAAVRLVFLVELARTDLATIHLLDAETYHTWALRLVAGDFGWHETYWMGPLYPHLVALVYLLAGPGGVAVPALQLAATVLNVWLVHRLALVLLRAGGEDGVARPAALLAAALYAFHGAPVFYAGLLLMATLVTTLLLLVALQAVRAQAVPTPRRWFVLGLLVGLTGLARGNVLLLVAALPVLLVGRADVPARRRVALAAVLAAGALAMVAPVTLRNVLVARDFTLLTSNGGVNLYIGQLPHGEGAFTPALQRPDAENDPSLELSLENEFGRDLKGSEVSRVLARRAWRTFRENLGEMPRLYLLKTWRFWSGYELPQIEAYVWWREVFTGLRLLPVPFTLLGALGLAGLAFLPRRPRLVVMVVVLGYFLSLLPFFPTSRYRQPIVPLLAVGAAAWLCALAGTRVRWRRAPSVRARAAAGVAAAGLVVLLWPAWTALPPQTVAWQVKLHESERAARRGDLRTVLAKAREAEEARPGLADTPFLLARHLEEMGAWTEAAAAMAQAAARAPHSRLARYRIGRIAEQAGRPDEALAAYRQAAAMSPDWSYPWLRAGLILRRQGQPAEALAALREAHARDPGSRRIRANLGSLLGENGLADEARAVLGRLVRDHPAYVHGWHNLAVLELQAGDLRAAAAAADRAAGLRGLTPAEREQVARLRAAVAAAAAAR